MDKRLIHYHNKAWEALQAGKENAFINFYRELL